MTPIDNPAWRVGGDPVKQRVFLAIEAGERSVVFSLTVYEAERLWQRLEQSTRTVILGASRMTPLGTIPDK